jgi:hypothetical protein
MDAFLSADDTGDEDQRGYDHGQDGHQRCEQVNGEMQDGGVCVTKLQVVVAASCASLTGRISDFAESSLFLDQSDLGSAKKRLFEQYFSWRTQAGGGPAALRVTITKQENPELGPS